MNRDVKVPDSHWLAHGGLNDHREKGRSNEAWRTCFFAKWGQGVGT
jgi:hypothetical protein